MMVVRAAPDTAGADGQDAKDLHVPISQFGSGQDGMMLLVMIDHEKAQ